MDANEIYQSVQNHYGLYAKRTITEGDAKYSQMVAQAFGYSLEELASIPEGANLGVSCGNPFATANLKEREVVIDLGSGAGLDVFLAANKVGPDGKAIGVDMSKDMLELAHRNLEKSKATNVSIVEASITSIPLSSETADCIISNCVINLVPHIDKPKVFHEMFRLLKPGGRVAISDLVAKKELPIDMKQNMALYVGCIAGASVGSDYEKYLKNAGFQGTLIVDTHSDLNLYKEGNHMDLSTELVSANADCCSSSCCSSDSQRATKLLSDARLGESLPPNFEQQKKAHSSGCCGRSCCDDQTVQGQIASALPADFDINEWIASVQIYAVKPSSQAMQYDD